MVWPGASRLPVTRSSWAAAPPSAPPTLPPRSASRASPAAATTTPPRQTWSSSPSPIEGHADLLASLARPLAGKIVVDCVNPLGFDSQGPYALAVADGSAAQEAQRILPDSTVVAAFHHVSAVRLEDPGMIGSTRTCWCWARIAMP